MTIKEIEDWVDEVGLEKLEVKMKLGRQVHSFICGSDYDGSPDADGKHHGNLWVYDTDGKVWICYGQTWEKGDSFRVNERTEHGKKKVFINGREMIRTPSLDIFIPGEYQD